MGKSCKEIAETLYNCMKETSCMKDEKKEIRQCMRDNPDLCTQYRNAYFRCKRDTLDMRTRIKGQKVY